MRRMGMGDGGRLYQLLSAVSGRDHKGEVEGNYISVDFCQHSPFPFCRTKVRSGLIIFKIL